jgi:hypothetical protein
VVTDLFGQGFTWSEPAAPETRPTSMVEPHLSPAPATDGATAKSAVIRGVQELVRVDVADVAAIAAWRRGVASLRIGSPPDSVSDRAWQTTIADAEALIDLWGADLEALGWSTLEIFGTNDNPRARRLDRVGLLDLLEGRAVLAVTATHASIRATARDVTRFDRRLVAAGGIPVWAVQREGVEVVLSAAEPVGGGRGSAFSATPTSPLLSSGQGNPAGDAEKIGGGT